ncbi:hypothetical protein ACGFH8_11895 [Micromonospora sp. NPDC049175]
MTLWTCKACGLLIVPDGTSQAALTRAMEAHKKVCTKGDAR